MSKLFSPVTFQSTTLKNRIVMSPMCMYSSMKEDGHINAFHLTHYISRAVGGAGLIMIEATAVTEEGRISPQDLGIWDDIKRTVNAFKRAAARAKKAEFDMIEIHAAHGYLLNQFLSPLTNTRSDHYGGSRENRYRIVKEIIEGIQEEWHDALFIRISADEYDVGGNSFEDILYFAEKFKEQGVDLIDCSSGGVVPVQIETFPGYQLKRAEKIKQAVNMAAGAVGLITTGIQAEEILQNNRADLVFIGRALLRNPYWPKAAADELNVALEAPKQYERGWK